MPYVARLTFDIYMFEKLIWCQESTLLPRILSCLNEFSSFIQNIISWSVHLWWMLVIKCPCSHTLNFLFSKFIVMQLYDLHAIITLVAYNIDLFSQSISYILLRQLTPTNQAKWTDLEIISVKDPWIHFILLNPTNLLLGIQPRLWKIMNYIQTH